VKKVRKAIIPAAGLGTRFLPATKAMPKEMLPILDKPTIQYIVEEAVDSGIEDIIIVTGKGKRAIEDHFDYAPELEQNLLSKNKLELLEMVKQPAKVDIHYIRQKKPKGLGHAVWCARKFIGSEPFAVLLGDDIVQAEVPGLKQLIQMYYKTGSSIIGVQIVSDDETSKYGVISPKKVNGRLFEIDDLVEKPKVGEAPSNFAIIGRYVFTPDIFEYLALQEIGADGEIQLTDAIKKLKNSQPVYGYHFIGKRFDVGDKLGFVKTTIEFALNNEEIGDQVLETIKEFISIYE
jgi:UTP--glucose-1-phosphate uridylyltransferase